MAKKLMTMSIKRLLTTTYCKLWKKSSFTLKEKIAFYKQKWRKENRFKIVFSFMVWCALSIVLKLQYVDYALIGAVAGLLSVLFYAVLNNSMMIYVENNVYKKQRKIDIQIYIIVLRRRNKTPMNLSGFNYPYEK
ncbi:MAG: hypothetical protein U0L48_04535 [Acutalibacteraceae bacterium]|nr:hypothetical protein [Acutalibacteraceae bacterium]